MMQRPPRSTHRYTLFPYTTLFRSLIVLALALAVTAIRKGVSWRVIGGLAARSEEHTSELQSHSGISYADFCLKQKAHHAPHPGGHRPAARRERVVGAVRAVLIAGRRAARCAARGGALRGVFFFNDPATTEIYTPLYTRSLHDALPISLAAVVSDVAGLDSYRRLRGHAV